MVPDHESKVGWLLYCYHRQSLADSTAPPGVQELFAGPAPWLAAATGHEVKLDYEPRSIVISQDGCRVAVGTKAGTIFLATRDGASWSSKPIASMGDGRGADAVRGLAFGGSGRVYACAGNGHAWVIFEDGATQALRLPADQQQEAAAWVARSERLLPLNPLNPPRRAPDDFLVLTRGYLTCRLGGDPPRLTVVQRKTGKLPLFPLWPEERISAGAWTADFLWLLGARGALYLYRYKPAGFDLVERYRLHYPRGLGFFGDLSPTPAGLAVLVADDLTFLPFARRKDDAGPRVRGRPYLHRGDKNAEGEREVVARTWLRAEGALDVAAWLPFYKSGPELAAAREVMVFVAQADRGLSFMSWPLGGADLPALSPLPVEDLAKATSALLVTMRTTRGGKGRVAGWGPTVLAVATRDHRLILRSVLDRRAIERVLRKECDFAKRSPRGEAMSPDEAWWLASRAITGDDLSADRLDACLRLLQPADIQRLARALMARPLQQLKETRAAGFKNWVRGLLRRAWELGEGPLADTCAEISEALAQLAPKGEPWLMRYEGLFRKWLSYGHTYGQKEVGLQQLYEMNAKGGRPLDALVYLTKRIRRRVDTVWQSQVADASLRPSAWDVRVSEDGGLALASFTDGTIAALDLEGTPHRFVAGDSIADHGVEIDEAGRLHAAGAARFRHKYHHGPYARRIYLRHLGGASYLAAFALRAKRAIDRDLPGRLKPRFVALAVEKRGHQLVISGCASCDLDSEGYALIERHVEGGEIHLLMGTAVQLDENQDLLVPFVEIVLHTGGELRIGEPKKLRASPPPGARTRIAEANPVLSHDRCWSLAAHPGALSGHFWAGFQSGKVACFRMSGDRADEVEGSRLQCEGAVWSMATSVASGAASEDAAPRADGSREAYLAYGTARGVLGIVQVGGLAAGCGGGQTRVLQIAQSREVGPVCGLFEYVDAGERSFLATTEEGVVSIFRLKPTPETPLGHRVDQFSLAGTLRATTLLGTAGNENGPDFLIASGEGVVKRLSLALPRGSRRRQRAANETGHLLKGARADLAQLFGRNAAVAGLRLLRVGDEQLRRFSLWTTMREAGRALWGRRSPHLLAEELEKYLRVLAELADECFHLRPFRTEPAKILWEEGSKVGRELAKAALDEPLREDLLQAALRIHVEVDDLCNRWLGFAHETEAGVLAHSFSHLVDWTDIALLGRAARGSDVDNEYRRTLLVKLIARRLNHDSQFVPLEALRVIGDAVWRTLVSLTEGRCREEGPRKPWVDGFGERTTDAAAGLYELALLVGELGNKALPNSRSGGPLVGEVARFFALMLLLTPSRSGVICQIFCESGLMEGQSGLRDRVLELARQYTRWLEQLVSRGDFAAMRLGTQLFELASETSEQKVEPSWRELERLQGQLGAGGVDAFSDASFYREMVKVVGAAQSLSLLPQEAAASAKGGAVSPSALLLDAGGMRFFEHSRRYLEGLEGRREEIRAAFGHFKSLPTEEQLKAWDTTYAALQAELARSELFEPQRSQYVVILRKWKSEIDRRGWEGLTLLETLDTMNRHVFRRDADQLLEAVVELACRAAPPFPAFLATMETGGHPVSLREHMRETLCDHPLLAALYEQTQRIVETNRLTSALLVAGVASIQGRSLGTVSSDQLFDAFASSCIPHGVRPERAKGTAGEAVPAIRGDVLLWRTIFSELALNLFRYGTDDRDRTGVLALVDDAGATSLVVHGNRPFVASLRDPERADVLACSAGDHSSKLQALAQSTLREGRRLAPGNASSTGSGLVILARLARLLNAELTCRVTSTLEWDAAPFETALTWEAAAAGNVHHGR